MLFRQFVLPCSARQRAFPGQPLRAAVSFFAGGCACACEGRLELFAASLRQRGQRQRGQLAALPWRSQSAPGPPLRRGSASGDFPGVSARLRRQQKNMQDKCMHSAATPGAQCRRRGVRRSAETRRKRREDLRQVRRQVLRRVRRRIFSSSPSSSSP